MILSKSTLIRALTLTIACAVLSLLQGADKPKAPPLSLSFGESAQRWAVVSGEFEYPASTVGTARAVAPKKGGLVLETALPAPAGAARGHRLTAVVRLRPTSTTPHVS